MKKHMHKQQSGFVSIIVTLIVMTIMSLIVLSFALLMRREQRNALDRQLSTQAFYAAESGVNDAVAALKANPALTLSDCPISSGDGRSFSTVDNNLNSSSGVSYTCVLINQHLTSLKYSSIGTDSSTVVPIRPNGTAKWLTISWQDSGGSTTFANSTASAHHYLPEAGVSDANSAFVSGTGILRTTIMPINSGGLTRANLIADEQTLFLYPTQDLTPNANGVAVYDNVNTTNNGIFADGHCMAGNSPLACKVKIDLSTLPGQVFYLRLKAIYKPVNVNIQVQDSGGNDLELQGVQAEVDSTGKANDVLRRIQVRVPLYNNPYFPEFGLESADSICKRLVAWDGGAQVDSSVPQGTPPSGVDFNKSHDFGANGSCSIN